MRSASLSGYGSGCDWKVLSARRPSPVERVIQVISKILFEVLGTLNIGLTNEENQALCGSFDAIWPHDFEFAHPGHDRADEVDVEDGVYVGQVEGHRND